MSDALEIVWSEYYRREWDDSPRGYVDAHRVAWGRSRRLAKIVNPARAFKAYLGVQAYDPGLWHVEGAQEAKFFVSIFVNGRTIALHTYPTCAEALGMLLAFHSQLSARVSIAD